MKKKFKFLLLLLYTQSLTHKTQIVIILHVHVLLLHSDYSKTINLMANLSNDVNILCSIYISTWKPKNYYYYIPYYVSCLSVYLFISYHVKERSATTESAYNQTPRILLIDWQFVKQLIFLSWYSLTANYYDNNL